VRNRLNSGICWRINLFSRRRFFQTID
jgi:hypothetical protein